MDVCTIVYIILKQQTIVQMLKFQNHISCQGGIKLYFLNILKYALNKTRLHLNSNAIAANLRFSVRKLGTNP